MYDIIGRRPTIGLSFVIICGSLIWIPYCAPSLLKLMTARVFLGIGVQIQLGNPLINDYVHKSTRGVATVMHNIGYIAGETFAMAVLFNCTKELEPTVAFVISSSSLLLLGIAITLMVKEHVSTSKLR
jgi:MFS family permease